MPISEETRERIRKNVGHPHRPVVIHDPGAVGPAQGLIGLLIRPRPGEPVPPAPELPPIPGPTAGPAVPVQGHTYWIGTSVAAAAREIQVSPRIGFPFQVRRMTFTGDIGVNDAFSFRLLVADDDDTTAVANPTGDDIVIPAGDLIGAEDTGMHAALTADHLVIEPWYARTRTPTFLKLKVHNATAGARILSVFVDLDELPT